MNLHIPIPKRRLVMFVACVPIDAQPTRMRLVMGRDFFTSPAFDWFFHGTNLKIANEDRAIVAFSFPTEVREAKDELCVRTDARTLHFRKRCSRELKRARGRGLPLARPSPRLHDPRARSLRSCAGAAAPARGSAAATSSDPSAFAA